MYLYNKCALHSVIFLEKAPDNAETLSAGLGILLRISEGSFQRKLLKQSSAGAYDLVVPKRCRPGADRQKNGDLRRFTEA